MKINGIKINEDEFPYSYKSIFVALWKNKMDIVKFLLKYDVNINVKDGTKKSLLHWAIIINKFKFGKWLVNYGSININRKDIMGRTPMDVAVQYNRLKFIKLLENRQSKDFKMEWCEY